MSEPIFFACSDMCAKGGKMGLTNCEKKLNRMLCNDCYQIVEGKNPPTLNEFFKTFIENIFERTDDIIRQDAHVRAKILADKIEFMQKCPSTHDTILIYDDISPFMQNLRVCCVCNKPFSSGHIVKGKFYCTKDWIN